MNRILKPAFAAILAAGLAGQALAADLTLQIEGLEEATGSFHVAVFDAAGWDKNDAVTGAIADVSEGTDLTFTGLAPGEYGVKIYQDVDGNGELNLGMWRIPTEPYGFSNDAPARMGPPKFAQARFELTEAGAVQTITLK